MKNNYSFSSLCARFLLREIKIQIINLALKEKNYSSLYCFRPIRTLSELDRSKILNVFAI